jgi:hypothetical protein
MAHVQWLFILKLEKIRLMRFGSMVLSEDQKTKIADTLRVFIAAIPVNDIDNIKYDIDENKHHNIDQIIDQNKDDIAKIKDGIDKTIEILESLKLGKEAVSGNIPTNMKISIEKLQKYITYFHEFSEFASDNEDIITFLSTIIQERIDALKQIKELNNKEIYVYSLVNKRLADPDNKYTPVMQAVFDLFDIQSKLSSHDLDHLSWIIDFLNYQGFHYQRIEPILANHNVLTALQNGLDVFAILDYICSEEELQCSLDYCELLNTVKDARKIEKAGLLSFNEYKTMGVEEKKKLAKTFAHPGAVPLFLTNKINIGYIHHEEIIQIVDYLSKSPAKEFVDRGLLDLSDVYSFAKLEHKTAILNTFHESIEKLIDDKVIPIRKVWQHLLSSKEECQQLINLINQGDKYFKLGILDIAFLNLDFLNQEKFKKLLDDLDRTTPTVLEFLATIENVHYCRILQSDKREILLDALWFPQVREIIKSYSSELGPDKIITVWEDERKKAKFLAALSDSNIMNRVKDRNDCIFTPYGKDYIIIALGDRILHPKVFPLFKCGYLSSEEIIASRELSPEALAAFAKYKLLLELGEVVKKPIWRSLGRFWRFPPAGIADLQKVLSKLDSIDGYTHSFDNSHIKIIDDVFNQAFNILEIKQRAYKGLGRREATTTATYKEEYDKLLQFQSVSLRPTHYDLGIAFMENGDTEKAFELFTQVGKTDRNYLDALSRAGIIAHNKGDTDDAKYLLTKTNEVANETKDARFASQCDETLIDCAI